MKRINRWIPVLVLVAAVSTACGEEKAAEGEASEEGSDTTSEEEAEEGEKSDEAKSDEAKSDEAAKTVAGESDKADEKADEAKPEPMGPEEEAALQKRCGEAFDNTVAIMQTAGAPAQIVTQMRQQRDKTVGTCLGQAKSDPKGTRMLDCMIAARLPADIQTCTRKFGDVKPLKSPVPGHEGHGH